MKRKIVTTFILLAFLLVSTSQVFAEEQPIVTAIEVKGLKRIEEGAIRARVSQKISTPLSQDKTTEDIKTIYKMGYFDNVKVDIEPFEGGIKIVYVVAEKPTIVKIELQGNKKYDNDQLMEKITLTVGAIADINLINDNAAKLRTYYEDEGYYLATVVPLVSKAKDGEVVVTYQIEENKQVKIRNISIIGNSAMSERKIKKTIKTEERGLFKFWGGYLKKEELALDVIRIKELYFNNGYIKAAVAEPKVELDEDKRGMRITFTVSEGQQFKVSSVDIAGNKAFSKDELSQLIKLAPKTIFNKKKMTADVAALSDKYADNGYALSSITPDLVPNDETRETKVIYRIEEGDKYRMGRVEISGNTKTRDKVIRREVRVDEGETYSASKIKRSEERLKNLQFFETVDMAQKPKQEDKSVDLDVKVKEKNTGFLSIGGGYSSVDKLVAMVDITQGNLFGKGQLIKLRGELGARSTFYELAFRDPYFLDYPVSFGTSLYRSYRDYGNYERRSTGFDVSLGKSFWEYWGASVTYGLDVSTISNVREDASQYVKDQSGEKTTSSVSYSVGRDTRDNHLDPTKGSKIALYETFAGLGGTNAFAKALIDAGSFHPIPIFEDTPTTYHIRGRAGTAGGILGKQLPIYEKYYIGGINTVRGLGYGDGGPKDPNGEPIGGFRELIINNEIIFPIVPELRFKGVVFYDMGRAYGDGEAFGTSLRRTAGAGIRWMSPIGPLRIEWGNNLSPKKGEAGSKMEFTFGSFF
ncbi:MAG: outer membrane protein assembly factor BamA [Nitrospirae bacterium]|nr:outer membrane protein assembly factor BamA [Nitrospirota bacterium]